MNTSARSLRFRVTLVLVLGLLAARSVTAQSPRPQGVWYLDEAHSDSIPPQFGQRGDTLTPGRVGRGDPGDRAPGVGGGPGTEGPVAGGGTGGYGARRPRRLDEKGIARTRQTLGLLRIVPKQIRIEGDSIFIATDESGAETSWRIGGKPVTEQVADEGDLETKVRWNREALVVERKVSGGGRVKESYELGLGGSRLIVFVSVEGLMQPLARTRQYVRSEE
jgi:hypothetical protein